MFTHGAVVYRKDTNETLAMFGREEKLTPSNKIELEQLIRNDPSLLEMFYEAYKLCEDDIDELVLIRDATKDEVKEFNQNFSKAFNEGKMKFIGDSEED